MILIRVGADGLVTMGRTKVYKIEHSIRYRKGSLKVLETVITNIKEECVCENGQEAWLGNKSVMIMLNRFG